MAARPRKTIDTSTYTGRFAARLKELREKKKLTVEELAEKSGIPRKTLYNWESGISSAVNEDLPKLAESLGMNPRNLIPKK